MPKDFSDFVESFFANYFKNGYVGLKKEEPTALLALNNDDYSEHTYAIAEWIVQRVIKGSVPFVSESEFYNFKHIAMSCVDEKNYKFVGYMLYKGTRFFNAAEKNTILNGKTNEYRIKSRKVFKKDNYSVVSCETIWGNKISFFADKDFDEEFDYLKCNTKLNGIFVNAKNWEVS
jgi:hypothetical protein